MKSQTRAWIIMVVLFVLWGTLPVSPFVYFSEMIREWAGLVFEHSIIPLPWQAVLIYLTLALLTTILLLLGRSRSNIYIAGFCALAGMVHHLILCIRTQRLYTVSFAIAIGLALALLFLLIKPQSPALWLSDAFIMALPVFILYDGLLNPLFKLVGLKADALEPFMPIPDQSLVSRLDGVFGLPQTIWAILPLLLALAPVILLSAKRKKG